MFEGNSLFKPSAYFPWAKWFWAAQGCSLKNVSDRILSCVKSNRLQQATLPRVVLTHKQVHPPQLGQREVAEELESGDVQRVDHRQVKFSAFLC